MLEVNLTRLEDLKICWNDLQYNTDNWHPYDYLVIAMYLPCVFIFQNLIRVKIKNLDFKTIWFAFNLSLSIYNWILFKTTAYILLYSLGFTETVPSHSDISLSGTFFLSKYVELIDTFFILFSGKRVTFLHYYHHMATLLFAWLNVVYVNNSTLYFIFMNSFIHTIMYAYYAGTCVGVKFKYKESITFLQILQMFAGIWILVHNMNSSMANSLVTYSGLVMYSSYAFLFLRFYIGTYLLTGN